MDPRALLALFTVKVKWESYYSFVKDYVDYKMSINHRKECTTKFLVSIFDVDFYLPRVRCPCKILWLC